MRKAYRGYSYHPAALKGAENLGMKEFENNIAIAKSYVPSQVVPIAELAEHGIEFLLIIEYCYFLLEQSSVDADVIQHAVKEYKSCGIAPVINQAIATSIQQHGQNLANLCQAFVTIILDNLMCENLIHRKTLTTIHVVTLAETTISAYPDVS
ncbi:hypothetical protein EDC04DRAFT_2757341 [Pisolithus marmoratus]|nr:hypothetical protein EDC04DRAFT_2757341 [Pisolithus marmoratus]